MTKNALQRLKDVFRRLSVSPFQRRIEDEMAARHPAAAALMEKLGHPRLYSRTKRNGKDCYADGNTICLVSSAETPLADEADMVYAALIDMAEKKGIGNEALSAERRQINSRIYTDRQGDGTRFKIADLDHAPDGRNAKLLRGCMDFLDSAGLPQCAAVAKLLREENVTLNLRPVRYAALSGGFSPDSREVTLYYDPAAEDLDIIAKLSLNIMHESCHVDQERKGILADMMKDANAYREVFHLNELQAHTVQYKTALQLLMQSPDYQDFVTGKSDTDGLAEKLGASPQISDRVCLQHLCRNPTGTVLLSNLQQRSLAADRIFTPQEAERMVKEALCCGEMTAVTENGVFYDTAVLSRMQRYVHSHIAVLNFSPPCGKGTDFEAAVVQHFTGDFALEKSGNGVDFAAADLAFISPVTGRAITVHAIENLWERLGFEDNMSGRLGQTVEKILADRVQKPPPAPQKRPAR